MLGESGLLWSKCRVFISNISRIAEDYSCLNYVFWSQYLNCLPWRKFEMTFPKSCFHFSMKIWWKLLHYIEKVCDYIILILWTDLIEKNLQLKTFLFQPMEFNIMMKVNYNSSNWQRPLNTAGQLFLYRSQLANVPENSEIFFMPHFNYFASDLNVYGIFLAPNCSF